MLSQIDSYDWEEAFKYSDNLAPVLDDDADQAPFSREDVAEIIAIEDGENDGPPWIGLFRLHDGRYAFLSAGCDYTGWDCQAGGGSAVANDLQKLIRFGMGDYERERLCLSLE